MKKVESFIIDKFHFIVISLLIFISIKSCDRESSKLSKRILSLESSVDSLRKETVTKKDLQIEGLRSEKRMIQSVDRKILDVNRQSEIDNQISELSK
jgi:hypothetical protein